jgi:simple sugar transport system ATP-binding protein
MNAGTAPGRAGDVTPIVELRAVSKDYGNAQVLYDVNLTVQPGEVLGLVGDNGAGKSTLLKILSGFHPPTRGEMIFRGRPVRFRSPAEARAAGIETVYQDLAIINDMSLWRNFFLGKELRRSLGPVRVLDVAAMQRICAQELQKLGLTRVRSPNEHAVSLSGGERQSLAITRAMYFGARLLLLDEPTAALSVRETRNVFAAIEHASRQGLGVIFIDHNMAHVHPVADRIILIEHGRVAHTLNRGDATIAELSDLVARTPVGRVGTDSAPMR